MSWLILVLLDQCKRSISYLKQQSKAKGASPQGKVYSYTTVEEGGFEPSTEEKYHPTSSFFFAL